MKTKKLLLITMPLSFVVSACSVNSNYVSLPKKSYDEYSYVVDTKKIEAVKRAHFYSASNISTVWVNLPRKRVKTSPKSEK